MSPAFALALPLARTRAPSAVLLSSPTRTCVHRRRVPRATATQPSKAKVHVQVRTPSSTTTTGAVVSPTSEGVSEPQVIEDTAYDRFMIWGLRHLLAAQSGKRSAEGGYAGLVDECRMVLAECGAEEQRRLVEALLNAAVIPPVGVWLFRNLFAKRPAFNADLTPLVFTWLVGEAKRHNAEEGGEGVLITKCRFLDEAKCKGLCVNMCQQPVQNLFTHTLGLPLRMTPNYDDCSCQMSFGVHPLPRDEDPALNSPCLTDCPVAFNFAHTHQNGGGGGGGAAKKECTVRADD